MDPPHFLLDALNESITSGTFIDTKFYVFSRRTASGHVYSPRALYCNSRILSTVPYFSSLFSDGFSEGQMRDINEGFPSDSHPHVEDYDYLSDSDLEDGSSCSGEDGEGPPEDDCGSSQGLENADDVQTLETTTPDSPPQRLPSVQTIETQNDNSTNDGPPRMGRVAIIRDIGAATCVQYGLTPTGSRTSLADCSFEALLYFLYTSEIKFASLSSDPRRELPAQMRAGDWSTRRLPSPSAKSIYRLADKYDIPALKEQAKAHIRSNLEHCDIVEEIFSSFAYFFPEVLSMQVPLLVSRMNEESKGGSEGATRKRLRNKIASLSQPQVTRAADALAMIWSCVKGPLEPPATQPKLTSSVIITLLPNWHLMKLAFHKSITTGVFVDVQFYAYNKTVNSLLLDPKPLFISSIIIEEWGPAITTQTAGVDSQAVCLVDGPIDDYEGSSGGPLSEIHSDGIVLKYRTEAITAESCEVVLLMSGAWKTWRTLFSYAYKGEMTFLPLQASADDSDSMVQARGQQSCSPRSVYALATTLGINNVKEVALKNIQSKLSVFNVMQELFSSFTASHKAVMEMEIEFFLTEKDPKLLTDYIQSVASGEASFFPTTLSLVYDGLVRREFPEKSPSNPFKFPGGQSATTPTPLQASSWTSTVAPSFVCGVSPSTSTVRPSITPTVSPYPTPVSVRPPITPAVTGPFTFTVASPSASRLSAPAPRLAPSVSTKVAQLRCARCSTQTRLGQLYDGLYCPRCPEDGKNGRGKKGRPFMHWMECGHLRTTNVDKCIKRKCKATFM